MSKSDSNSPVYEDGPFYAVALQAETAVKDGGGNVAVFQKWSCPFCGDRVTMTTPNTFYREARHEDCAVSPTKTIDLTKRGCNYLLIQTNTDNGKALLKMITNG